MIAAIAMISAIAGENVQQSLPSYGNHTSAIVAITAFQSLYPNFEFRWKGIYICPIRRTVKCKLGEFQFKILHRILSTNKRSTQNEVSWIPTL